MVKWLLEMIEIFEVGAGLVWGEVKNKRRAVAKDGWGGGSKKGLDLRR